MFRYHTDLNVQEHSSVFGLALNAKRWGIEHFTVVDLVPQPSSECEADGDLILIQTSFALLWKLSLKNTS